jgi:hypothetical protein
MLGASDSIHIPILKFDTLEELKSFKSESDGISDYFNKITNHLNKNEFSFKTKTIRRRKPNKTTRIFQLRKFRNRMGVTYILNQTTTEHI